MRASSELVRMFTRAGFDLVRVSKHMIWRCPCGHTQLTCSATPGKGNRSAENTKADIARALRVCAQNQQQRSAA